MLENLDKLRATDLIDAI